MELKERTPVFILGINPRCGSNYIFNLLVTHPDCVQSNHNGEDFILHDAHILLQYYQTVTSKWSKVWGNTREKFLVGLSEGILRYLEPEQGNYKYHVSKTPLADNIDKFLEIFNRGYLLVIYRSGQDVVESHNITFKSRFDDAVRSWVRGADSILKAIHDKEMVSSGRVMFIKYEDLYSRNEEIMSSILDFLKLDKSKFDFNRSANFDVIGSAIHRGDSKNVTWDPVPKDASFNPLARFKHWSKFKHYRFNWMAGNQSKALGYPLYHDNRNIVYYGFNIIMSVYDFMYRTVRRISLLFKAVAKRKNILDELKAIRIT